MSKRYNIRWKQSDNVELRKAVKNFNAKITRLSKKYPEIAKALPEKVSMKDLKDLIGTRDDLKRELRSLQDFSSKNNKITKNKDGSFTGLTQIPNIDNNIDITEWQKSDMEKRARRINRKRKKRLKELMETQLEDRGEPLGYTLGDIGIGDSDMLALKPIKAFSPKIERFNIKEKSKALRKQSQDLYWNWRDYALVNNYVTGLLENFNPTDIKDVIEAIDNMGYDEFYAKFKKEGANFEIVYPPDKEQYQEYLEALKSIWIPKYK